MRRLCLCLSFLLGALVVAPSANAQGGLSLNQTYRDVIQLSFPAGKNQIPLPEGEWELLGLQEDSSGLVTRFWRIYLGKIEDATLYGQITITINHDLSAGLGWSASDLCDRDDVGIVEIKSNRDGDVDCWASSFVKIRLKRSWPEGRQQMHNTLLSRGVSIPGIMARAIFVRRSSDNMLTLTYYFHRYHPDKLHITRARIKSWARSWKPKVDAGFLGNLEVTKTRETFTPPEQTPKTAISGEKKGDIEARLTRLKKLFDEGLITDSEYTEPYHGAMHGFETNFSTRFNAAGKRKALRVVFRQFSPFAFAISA